MKIQNGLQVNGLLEPHGLGGNVAKNRNGLKETIFGNQT
jgi:hypothetical protein